MVAQPDVDQLIRQTRRYEFADGLRDLQLAVILGLGGITVWLAFEPFWLAFIAKLVQVWGRWAVWLNMLPVLLAPLAAWGILALMNFLRRRWLWRESGMVKPSRWMVPRKVNLLSAVILVGGIALGFGLYLLGQADVVFALRMLWVATGWSFGYTLIGVGRNLDLTRYVWLGVSGGLASTLLLVLPLTFGQAALAFGLGWCLLLAGSGIIVLWRAVRSLPSKPT